MQLPHPTTSASTLVKEFGLYHLTRLKAEKGLDEMAAAWEKAQARLRDRVAAYEAAQASTMTAMAVRDGDDAALDDVVRRFGLLVLAKSGNSRKSPLYLTYFPDGMTPVVNAPLEAELQKVNVIISKLGQEEDEELKAFAGPLSAAANALAGAMDAHRAAHDAELQAYGLCEQEKINWFDAYKLNYRALYHMYYKTPKKAESFFRPVTKAKKANGGVAPTATKA
jgi:hypothetical protein